MRTKARLLYVGLGDHTCVLIFMKQPLINWAIIAALPLSILYAMTSLYFFKPSHNVLCLETVPYSIGTMKIFEGVFHIGINSYYLR